MRKKNYKKLEKRISKNKEILNKKEYPEICSLTGFERFAVIKNKGWYRIHPMSDYAFEYPVFNETEQIFYYDVYNFKESHHPIFRNFIEIETAILHLEAFQEVKKEFKLKVKYSKRGHLCKVKQLKY